MERKGEACGGLGRCGDGGKVGAVVGAFGRRDERQHSSSALREGFPVFCLRRFLFRFVSLEREPPLAQLSRVVSVVLSSGPVAGRSLSARGSPCGALLMFIVPLALLLKLAGRQPMQSGELRRRHTLPDQAWLDLRAHSGNWPAADSRDSRHRPRGENG